MCLICYEPSVCELCKICIKTIDVSYFIQNKIDSVNKNVAEIFLNLNYMIELGGVEIFTELIDQIDSFRFLIRSEWESASPPFLQVKDDKTTSKLHFVSRDVKSLRRLLLLILIENSAILSMDFIQTSLRLLQTHFALLKFLTGFKATDLSKCRDVITKDLQILKSDLAISKLNLSLFEDDRTKI
ncbi:hypothetical protein LCDVSa089R [Lymphocystis disease virus 3]|uniref:Uncharacterized protein n=1 Tax=Lymphocystis disease virus 3 TaxID=2560566 RepID=A0A1B2RVZ1_9VIRU|nr:hypothetical protein BZK12_gp089 [Lymphocystis disease virus Sa]AOC55173.1 hypothetical protein LCDVSa089R [Lymphocystis disease virus 3]